MESKEQRQQRWQGICDRFRRSGMTQTAFCEQNGIKQHQLYYWLPRTLEDESVSRMQDLVCVGSVDLPIRHSVLRIRVGSTAVSELELPADETVIATVLRAAASL